MEAISLLHKEKSYGQDILLILEFTLRKFVVEVSITKRLTMSLIMLSKQFVTDENGNQIGVILPMADYLLVESLLRQHQPKSVPAQEQRRKQLQRAIEIMREEYAKDAELTAFTALDGEDFVQ